MKPDWGSTCRFSPSATRRSRAPSRCFVAILCSLLSVILSAGVILYHLGIRRGEARPIETLFDGFFFAGKIILLYIVMAIFITLWSMLLFFPGIIAAYRYRFAMYNLCENPEMGVMEALNMSKAQTYGFKAQLFLLDLSFLGWEILCGLTLGILNIWISPYIAQTESSAFFRRSSRSRASATSPASSPRPTASPPPNFKF